MLIGLVLRRAAGARARAPLVRAVHARTSVDDGTITPDELHELSSVRRRWRARRAAGARHGGAGKRLKGLVQRQQINLAMVASRVGDVPDHPDLVKQRDLVRALKAEYAALAGAAGTGPRPGAAAARGGAGAGCRARRAPPTTAPAASHRPRRPPAWLPTHRVPDEGMAAWAAPDPTHAPMVNLGGRLELVVVERAGDWARVAAVNGWSGWVDGRRLVPRE